MSPFPPGRPTHSRPPQQTRLLCTDITPIAPMAASPTLHPQSVSLCRGANSLRPHPDGPHTRFCSATITPRAHPCFWPEAISPRASPHKFWPEAIAARWSCGPHVTPASNRRRRCRAGISRPPTARHFGDVPPM
jgi:hypothetical protein